VSAAWSTDPAEMDAALEWMDANTGREAVRRGRGSSCPGDRRHRGGQDMAEMIQQANRDFVERTACFGVPPLPQTDRRIGTACRMAALRRAQERRGAIDTSRTEGENALGSRRRTIIVPRKSAGC